MPLSVNNGISCIFTPELNAPLPRAFPALQRVIQLQADHIAKTVELESTASDLIVSSDYLNRLNSKTLEQNRYTYPQVLAGGQVRGNWESILQFSNAICTLIDDPNYLDHSLTRYKGLSIAKTIEMRAILPDLLEYIVKPIEALSHFFESVPFSEAKIVTQSTDYEQMVQQIAAFYQKPVKVIKNAPATRARFLQKGLGFLGRLKNPYVPPNLLAAQTQFKTEKKPPTSQVKDGVLIFGMEERRLRRFGPIATACKEGGTSAYIASAIGKTETYQALANLSKQGHTVLALENYCQMNEVSSTYRTFYQNGLEVAKKLRRSIPPEIRNAKYKGVSIWPLFEKRLLQNIRHLWGLGAALIELSDTALTELQPKKLLFSCLGVHSLALSAVAKKRGIPIYYYLYNPLIYSTEFWIPLIEQTVPHDFVITGTVSMRERYIQKARANPAHILVGGDVFTPKLENDGSENLQASKREARKKMGVPQDAKVLLLLSSYLSPEVTLEKKHAFFKNLSMALSTIPNTHLVVKIHPNETKTSVEQELRAWSIEATLLHYESLSEVLKAADAAAMLFSQSGFEVLMSGVPLIIFQDQYSMNGYDAWIPYIREKVAALLTPLDDPTSTLKELLFTGPLRDQQIERGIEFVQNYISPTDGRSAERIAEALGSDK